MRAKRGIVAFSFLCLSKSRGGHSNTLCEAHKRQLTAELACGGGAGWKTTDRPGGCRLRKRALLHVIKHSSLVFGTGAETYERPPPTSDTHCTLLNTNTVTQTHTTPLPAAVHLTSDSPIWLNAREGGAKPGLYDRPKVITMEIHNYSCQRNHCAGITMIPQSNNDRQSFARFHPPQNTK